MALPRVMLPCNLSMILVALLWLQQEWFLDHLALGGRTVWTPLALELADIAPCEKVSQGSGVTVLTRLEVIE